MAKILIIDDDKMICEALTALFIQIGHEVVYANTLEEGLDKIFSETFDLVFLDVRLPDGNGIEAIPRIKDAPSSPEIIIITGEGDPDGAELAIKSGSWDYIQKPLFPQKVILPLTRVLQYREKKVYSRPSLSLKREGIIGQSPQMERCFDLVVEASQRDTSVLLTGESGTGKELFAWAIHTNSDRAGKRFIVVDCAALPKNLVENILFGHEKGAFTSADKPHEGMIKEAHEGTLFLDEVGELPLDVQSSFLRVLQEHRFRPIGSRIEIKSDFRLIAATNRDLDQLVKEKKFREDLYFRLQAITIDLPPLRSRTQDIREIALYYMTKLCDRYGKGTKGFSPEFLEALNTYDWPGNVRELINAIERTLSIADDEPTLFPFHLPTRIRAKLAKASVQSTSHDKPRLEINHKISKTFLKFRELIEATEKSYFKDLVSLTSCDIKEICRLSGLSRAQVYRLLKKHDIT